MEEMDKAVINRDDAQRKNRTYELAVDITTDSDRTSNWLHIGLFHQDFSRLWQA
jgi:hypothetical protein